MNLSPTGRHLRRAVLAAACALAPHLAIAADAVTDAVQSAYAPYRAALFRTNSGAQAESLEALESAVRAWRAVATRFATERPSPYDRDTAFAKTLADVAAAYDAAAAQVRAGRLGEAHETLERVRDHVAELRRRNGVVTYSDTMNAYHAVMEQVLTDAPKRLAEPQGLLPLLADAAVLDHWAGRLRSEAPPAVVSDPEFAALLQPVEASARALKQALLAQDAAAARAALAKIKPAYSRLFLRFG